MLLTSKSIVDTHVLAKQIIDKLEGRNVIALYGELGAGKTTFVQGLAQALGITQRLISPTFILMRQYPLKHALYNSLYHLDLYRVDSAADLKSIDLAEIITDPKHLVVIEWAEKANATLPLHRADIKFITINEGTREINVRLS